MKILLAKFKTLLRIVVFKITNYLCMIFPVKDKRVLFLSDQRAVLGANLKCIYDRVSEDEYEKVLILKESNFKKRNFKDKIKLVYYITTSKYIILDDWAKSISMMKRRKKLCSCGMDQELLKLLVTVVMIKNIKVSIPCIAITRKQLLQLKKSDGALLKDLAWISVVLKQRDFLVRIVYLIKNIVRWSKMNSIMNIQN